MLFTEVDINKELQIFEAGLHSLDDMETVFAFHALMNLFSFFQLF